MAAAIELNAFSPANAMLQALRERKISAVELLDSHLQRCERYEPELNSIVVRDFERARQDAKLADERRAHGDPAPLLGLPITIKESIDVEGLPSTAGVLARVGHRAARDAPTVERLRAAGAVVFGKTNVCTWLADYQADNPIYGRTNNPWDLMRTPGGSSGGSATLAAGLTSLDLGSDLGGSIRVPAAFCGLWGHKPSEGIVPNTGHFPGSDLPNATLPLAVQGPHARSAYDLELALDVIAGADSPWSGAWNLRLPAARANTLSKFRIAVLSTPSWLSVDSEIVSSLDLLTRFLGSSGAKILEACPAAFGDLREYYGLFRSMMSTAVSINWPDSKRRLIIEDKVRREEEFHAADAKGIAATAAQYVIWSGKREAYRATWGDFFKDFDLLITPVTLTTAFEHTAVPNADRRLIVHGRPVEFEYMSFFPGLATLAGLPATVIPAGRSASGLPIGLQIIGPFLEDRTPISFAQLLERELWSFQPPPAYPHGLS